MHLVTGSSVPTIAVDFRDKSREFMAGLEVGMIFQQLKAGCDHIGTEQVPLFLVRTNLEVLENLARAFRYELITKEFALDTSVVLGYFKKRMRELSVVVNNENNHHKEE